MTDKKYFIISTVLCGLSLVALIVAIILLATGAGTAAFFMMLVLCVVFGFASNILVRKVSNSGKKERAVYVLSYLQYLAPFGVIWLVRQILNILKMFFKMLVNNESNDKVYTVIENGFERKLTFFDYGTDSDGVQFKRFKDDCGYYWRTYDDCSTFVKE